MNRFLYHLGGAVCHQIQQRSLFINGNPLPVCARCTGIYLGITIGFLVLFLRKKWKGNQPPPLFWTILLSFSFFPFMLDGGASYLGIWKTNNFIRLLTGLCAGYALPVFFVLLLHFQLEEENKNGIVTNAKDYFWLFIPCILVAIAVYKNFLPFYLFVGGMIIFGIFLLYTGIFSIFWSRILKKEKKALLFSSFTAITAMVLLSTLKSFL